MSAHNAGDLGLIPGLGRSPGKGNGNLSQYSYLENPMDRGAWDSPRGGKELDMTEQLHFLLLSTVLTASLNKIAAYVSLCCIPGLLLFSCHLFS